MGAVDGALGGVGGFEVGRCPVTVEDGVAGVHQCRPDGEPLPVRAYCQDHQMLVRDAGRVLAVERLVEDLESGQVLPG